MSPRRKFVVNPRFTRVLGESGGSGGWGVPVVMFERRSRSWGN